MTLTFLASSPNTTLFDNPALPQGMGSSMFGPFTLSCWPVAHSFIHDSSGKSVISVGQGNIYTVLHLSSFCTNLFTSSQTHRPLTEYEQLCSPAKTPRHLLSLIYKLLHALLHDQLATYTRRWSVDLGRELTTADWQTLFHFTHKSTVCCCARKKTLNSFPGSTTTLTPYIKYSHRYLPPAGGAVRLRKHIFKFGRNILGFNPFGLRFFSIYSSLYDEPLAPTPEIALLSKLPGLMASQKWM